MQKKYRLGIIGTGRIAHRFVPETKVIEELDVVIVYNPRLQSAKSFAEEFAIPDYTDNMDIFSENADAVYIAAPHETHVSYAREMLLKGKHVLCEKPLCFSKEEAEELFALAKENQCVLMEAIKTAYCPGFLALQEVIRSGKIGEVVDVEACFSRISELYVREVWDIAYGGSFTEFGTYALLPIVKLLGTKNVSHNIWSTSMQTGVDAYTKMSFDYGNATAMAKTGLAVKSEGQLVIAGTKGYILSPSPWWITRYFEVRYEDPNQKDEYNFSYDGQGLRYEIQVFVDKINGTDADFGVSAEESIWLAAQMERFLESQSEQRAEIFKKQKNVNIWAHRGCSLAYPENTLSAFQAAAELKGITGIELDVQLTKDNVMVVFHDETVDQTTNGSGALRDFTLQELKNLEIAGRDGTIERIPTMEEVFQLLEPYCRAKGLLINIELKNSKVRYEGMEEQIIEMVRRFGLEEYIVYSSFLPESMKLLKELDKTVQTAILGTDAEWCREKAIEMQADAIHPWNRGMRFEKDAYLNADGESYPVRVWNSEEPFFGQERVLRETEMTKYGRLGAADVITNVPEYYIKQ